MRLGGEGFLAIIVDVGVLAEPRGEGGGEDECWREDDLPLKRASTVLLPQATF